MDLPALIKFLKGVRPAAWINEYPGVVDLQEALGRTSIQEKTRLWINEQGEPEAFVFVLEPYNQLVFEVAPDVEPRIEDELIAWGIKCANRSMEDLAMNTLDTSCREDDLRRIKLLERHGFIRLEVNSLRLARRLDASIPAPQLPAGFSIRAIFGEEEVDQLVVLHRAAFKTSNMTREERLSIMRAPQYDPTLDLLVISPDGRFAAYCTCSISSAENKLDGVRVGHTDPVAVHPDFQRLGLARALLLKGAQLLKERGMELAMLGTSSENLAMQKTARAAGFRVYSKRIWFSKPIPDA
jgi:mycothiol synthase